MPFGKLFPASFRASIMWKTPCMLKGRLSLTPRLNRWIIYGMRQKKQSGMNELTAGDISAKEKELPG
jgi:hypothetical protein